MLKQAQLKMYLFYLTGWYCYDSVTLRIKIWKPPQGFTAQELMVVIVVVGWYTFLLALTLLATFTLHLDITKKLPANPSLSHHFSLSKKKILTWG